MGTAIHAVLLSQHDRGLSIVLIVRNGSNDLHGKCTSKAGGVMIFEIAQISCHKTMFAGQLLILTGMIIDSVSTASALL